MPRVHLHFAAVALMAAALAGCGGPEPRSFNDFMRDALARDGALARCNQDRDASLRDVECANARRAAAAVAVQQERERREELEWESERKLEQIRRMVALEQQRTREAAEAEAEAVKAAYELQWLEEQGRAPGEAPDDSAAVPPPAGVAADIGAANAPVAGAN